MSDLVERLRISAQRSNLNNEAADEIERNREAIGELVGALKLALDSHNLMLPTDPPITAWEYRRVGEIGRAAITKHSTTTEKRK